MERDGLHRHLDVASLVAVQAQAHYTQLFDGDTTWFCPLSISEVEAGLDPAVFVRVHRSHIVNLDRVSVAEECRRCRGRGDDGAHALSRPEPPLAPALAESRGWRKGCIWPSD